MHIEPYTPKYKNEIISLILNIQNNESKINLSLKEQPDLLDISKCYQQKGGEFWLALSDGKVIGTIGLMLKENNCAIMKKFFVKKDFRPQKVGLALYQKLLTIWEASVRATHLFLSDAEILQIKEYVPQAFASVEHLIIAEDEAGEPIAFMVTEKERMEMLFLSPSQRGKGIGRQLIQFGIQNYGIYEVTVNVQNPQAVGFYEHLGFKTYNRTDCDEAGNPYPLLYMRQ